MSDQNCKKCKYFQPIHNPESRYMTMECSYRIRGVDADSGKVSFSKTQASLFFEILPDDCEYYSPTY